MEHYVNIVKKNIDSILCYTRYLAADGYFMKISFIEPLLKSGLHIITRMRPDANLSYLYNGPQKTGRGRKKLYSGKVDVKNIDKGKWESCYEDDYLQGFELKVWCVSLKRIVKAVYVEFKDRKAYTIFVKYRHRTERRKDHPLLSAAFSDRISDKGCKAIYRIGRMPGTK